MLNSTTIAIILLFVSIYALGGTIYFGVASVRNLLKERNALKQNLVVADEYIQDLENEAGELASGYALMATTLEEHTLLLSDLQAHMDVIDEHLAQPFKVQIMTSHSMSNEYTGPDECNEDEPYSESDCPTLTPLPDYLVGVEVEGLDTL